MKLKLLTALTLGFIGIQAHADTIQTTQPAATTTTTTTTQVNSSMNNKQAGEAFLQANKTKPGVVTLPDGLQYKIITEGKG